MAIEKVNMTIEQAREYLYEQAVEKSGLDNMFPVCGKDDLEAGFSYCQVTGIVQFCYNDKTDSTRTVAVILI